MQSDTPDLGDIKPDLELVRDTILGCETLEQLNYIANDEMVGNKKLSTEIYNATKDGGPSQYGDTDYADRISNGIVNAIKV